MRTKLSSLLAGIGLVATASMPAIAHHAFGGEFDPNKPVLLKGKITTIEWVNPHAWIHIEVTNPEGKKDIWMIEGGSPNSLLRRGVTKDSLKVGTEIVVDGYQSRDYTMKRANGRNITYTTPEQRSRLGIRILMGGKGIFPAMTVRENLEMAAFVYRGDDADFRRRIDRAYDLFPALAEKRKAAATTLSA